MDFVQIERELQLLSARVSTLEALHTPAPTATVETAMPTATAIVEPGTWVDSANNTWTLPTGFEMPVGFNGFYGAFDKPIGWTDIDGAAHPFV